MTWQDVLSEFGETGNTAKEMAEEIVRLRSELKIEQVEHEAREQMTYKRLARSEAKREKLREALEKIASCKSVIAGDCPDIAQKALAADSEGE